MENNSPQDDFERVLREIDRIVDDTARLQSAIDQARQEELTGRRFRERRQTDRRLGAERRKGERRAHSQSMARPG
jgi:hypothetical protein